MTVKRALVLLAVAAALIPTACGSRERLAPQQAVERTSPAVVAISGKFGELDSGGSGVVFDAKRGLVLTNAHVVSTLSALKAKVGEEAPVPARVLGRAPCDDLAVLELVRKPPGLREIPFGSSGATKRGEHVTALGYPGDFTQAEPQTLRSTDSRVSNPAVRAQTLDSTLPQFPRLIQHQAPLDPGDSGGALVNDFGQLIGVNTEKNLLTGSTSAEGQSYAIPVDQIKPIVEDLKKGDTFDYVGWKLVPFDAIDISDQFAVAGALDREVGQRAERVVKKRKLEKVGLYNMFSDEPSPALEAGIVAGDVVTTVDDTPITVCGRL